MKRAISLLLMVVMVLAPCAVAHAANLSGHHGSPTVASEFEPSEHMRAVPSGSHEEHGACAASGHGSDQATCSGNCEILQRVTETNAAERSAAELQVSFTALAIVTKPVLATQGHRSDSAVSSRPVQTKSDSKTVLRKTARLRL